MHRYLSYKDEMKRLERLLAEVSTDEESTNENDDDDEDIDEEEFSPHETSSEEELDSDDGTDESQLGEFYTGKDGVTKWNKVKPRQNIRTMSHNIVTKLPGNVGNAKNVSSPIDAWLLLFDSNLLEQIVYSTNIYMEKIANNFQRERDAKKTDLIEMKALVGLLYLCGVHKSSHVNVKDIWATDGTGLEIFHRTMSYKRFLFLLRCLRFDDVRDRLQRKEFDKLAPVRSLFELFISNCKKLYNLGEYITIDEKLEPFRGRCPFRQYIPSKPAKYGIKIFALVDSRTFYTWNMEIYAGMQPEGPFRLENNADKVVMRLVTPIFNTGRNLTVDNWYTSVGLAKDLLSKKITVVGTLRKNKREVPKEFTSAKKRELHTTIFGFQKHMTLVSYTPKKNKCVLLLSTMHNDDAIDISSGESKKPEIITFYNMTKGAVDVVDEMSAAYSTARITNRWPMVVFFSMLNTAAINARVILMSTDKPDEKFRKRRLFLKDLALELLKEHTERRKAQPNISKSLRMELSSLLPEKSAEPPCKKQKNGAKKRCHICPSIKDRKSKSICTKCEKNVCTEHSSIVCNMCN